MAQFFLWHVFVVSHDCCAGEERSRRASAGVGAAEQKNKLATVKAHVHRCPGGWAAEVKVAKRNGFQYVVCLSVQACFCTHCKVSSSAVMTATAMITACATE